MYYISTTPEGGSEGDFRGASPILLPDRLAVAVVVLMRLFSFAIGVVSLRGFCGVALVAVSV